MGALPSGSDPEEFDLGDYGITGAGLSGLADRTQDNIEAALKAQMKGGNWAGASSILFQNLDPSLPYTVAVMKAIAEALLGSIIGADTLEQIFDVIGAWSEGLEQAWEDFWSAFGIDINVVQNDLNTIFAVLGDIANPEAWNAAWLAFLDILTQFGLTADSEHHPFDFTKLVTDLTKDFMKPWGLILDPDSPLNAAKLFGQFAAPVAWLINKPPEMLWNPGFSGSDSLTARRGWESDGAEWDGSVYRTVSEDSDPGSAKISCDGTDVVLTSNTFKVMEGQNLDVSAEVMWSALTASGKPIRVTLEGSGSAGNVTFLVGEAGISDGLDPLGWTGAPSGAKSVALSNDWLVPAGVDTVFLKVEVTAGATAGTVWLDAASVIMEQSGIPTEWLSELTDALAQVFSPFHDVNNFFDAEKWEAAWQGVLTILGLAQSDNAIIQNPNSLWTRLFQSTIPTGALNLHPDMDAVNDELAIIFNPFDNSAVDRAQAWDDLMGLFGLESHTADTQQWWDDVIASLFPNNSQALKNKSGAQTAQDWIAAAIHDLEILLDVFHWKYTAQEWTDAFNDFMKILTGTWTGTVLDPATVQQANAQTEGSASTSQANNDLVTSIDSTIPNAPTFGWLQGAYGVTSSVGNSVPYPGPFQSKFYYYVVTAVKNGKESVPSAEKYAIILGPATITINWTASTTSGVTYNVYRGTEPGKENLRVAAGLTGTSFTDSASSAQVSASPGTTAATAGSAVATAQSTANTANSTANTAKSTVDSVIDGSTQVSPDTVPTLPGTKIGSSLPAGVVQAVPSGHVASISPELLWAPNFGAAYGDKTAASNVTFSTGSAKITANSTTTGIMSNGIAVAQGQIVNVAVTASWTGLSYNTFAPIRFDIVGYLKGKPAILLTLADVELPTSSGSTNFAIVVQVGNDIDALCLRPTVGSNATSGTVTFTNPRASHTPIISSNSIGSVEYKIVTNPIGRDAQDDSIGYALQSTLDTLHQALGGDGQAAVPADVATLLNITNQTAIQALQKANANAALIADLQQAVADLQSVPPPPPPSTFTPTMRKFASPGSFNYAIPAGATTLSILCLGGGGASGGGGTINLPGSPGLWSNGANVTTWDVATLLGANVTNITGTVGSGGIAGNSSQGGSTGYGTNSVVNGVAGYPNISGSFGWANGTASSGNPSLTGPGPSPAAVPLPGGFFAYGGGSVGSNTKGAAPGGAGGGAKNFFSDLRANGAPGAVWIVAT